MNQNYSFKIFETKYHSIVRILETEIHDEFVVALARGGHALKLPSACLARRTKIQGNLAQ